VNIEEQLLPRRCGRKGRREHANWGGGVKRFFEKREKIFRGVREGREAGEVKMGEDADE
jgi:hypothetical protein